MKLREINRSATVAWGHSTATPLLAAATVAGTMTDGFESTGTLEFFSIDFSKDGDLQPIASITTNEKVHKLAWGTEMALQNAQFEFGILAGALESGVISLWNPVPIIDGSSDKPTQFALADKHSGAVKGLDFNPHQGSLLASGGLHGEVFIWDLNSVVPYAPGAQKSPSGESDITSIGWNRQVRHILATSTANGMAVVWDLRAKRAVLNFKDSHTPSLSSLAWNPSQSTQLVTCSDDDSNPVVHVWDLKNTFAPLKTLQGHSAGVLSLSWCPSDSNLLLSCGKDHRTICWDLSSSRIVGELSASEGWALDVQWSPVLPAVASRSSLPGKIELFSVNDFRLPADDFNKTTQKQKTPLPPPPSWLLRPTTVSFGFGGKLVSVPAQRPGEKPAQITIKNVVTENSFLQQAESLHAVIKKQQFAQYCVEKSTPPETSPSSDAALWNFLRVLFEKDARTELLSHLGFDRDAVSKEVNAYIEKLAKPKEESSSPTTTNTTTTTTNTSATTGSSDDGVSQLFSGSAPDEFDFTSLEKQPSSSLSSSNSSSFPAIAVSFSMTDTTESMITKSLLVGNFQAAVDCCFSVGRLADALVLAAFGGQELLKQTHTRYLGTQKSPFMHMVSKIAKKEFKDLVTTTSLEYWREVLAILCTYANADKFQELCGLLANRLNAESSNTDKALLCYICAGDMERAVDIWIAEGVHTDTQLQNLIEKSVIFSFAINQKVVGEKLGTFYAKYAEKLASQGALDLAYHYISLAADPSKKESLATQLHQRLQIAIAATTPVTNTTTTTTTTVPKIPTMPVTPSILPTPGITATTAPAAIPPTTFGIVGVKPPGPQRGGQFTPIMPTTTPPSQIPPLTTTLTPGISLISQQPNVLTPTRPTTTAAVAPVSVLQPPPRGIITSFTPPPVAPQQTQVLPTLPPVMPTVQAPTHVLPSRGNVSFVSPPTTTSAAPVQAPPKVEPPPPMAPPTNLAAPKSRHHTEEAATAAATHDFDDQINANIQAVIQLAQTKFTGDALADFTGRFQEISDKIQKEGLPQPVAQTLLEYLSALLQQNSAEAHTLFTKISAEHFNTFGSKGAVGLKRALGLL